MGEETYPAYFTGATTYADHVSVNRTFVENPGATQCLASTTKEHLGGADYPTLFDTFAFIGYDGEMFWTLRDGERICLKNERFRPGIL